MPWWISARLVGGFKYEHAPRHTPACSCIQQKEITMGSLEGIDFVALIETLLGLLGGGGETETPAG